MRHSDGVDIIASKTPPQRHLTKHMRNLPRELSIAPRQLSHSLREELKYVRALCVDTTGNFIAAASGPHVFLLDVADEKEIMRYDSAFGAVTSVGLWIGRKRQRLVIGTSRGAVVLYDLDSGKVLGTRHYRQGVISVHISAAGELFAAASGAKAYVHSFKHAGLHRMLACDAGVRQVQFSDDQTRLHVTTDYGAEVWDIKERKRLVACNANIANQTRRSDEIDAMIAGFAGRSAFVWDMETGALVGRYRHPDTINHVAHHAGRRLVVTACADTAVRVFSPCEPKNGDEPVKTFSGPERMACAAVSSDGSRLYTGSDDIHIWDMETGARVKQLKGYSSPVISICLTSDDRYLIVGGYHGVAKMYDLVTGLQVRRFGGHSSWIKAVALCEDHNILVTGGFDGTARVFSISGRLHHTLRGHKTAVQSVDIGKGGIIATGGQDGTIVLWDLKTGDRIRAWHAHGGRVRSLAFGPEGKHLISAGQDGLALLWNIETHGCEMDFGHHSDLIYFAGFSPDHKFFCTASQDTRFKVFDRNGRLIRGFGGHNHGVRSLFWHTDGTLISTSLDCTVKRWDPMTGKCLHTYSDLHYDWIRCARVRANKILVTGSKDGTVCFSDMETGRHLARLHNLDHGVLWTTPPEEYAPAGWFFTDREELIAVMESVPGGEPRLLDAGQSCRRHYLATYNSRMKVMAKLESNGADQGSFDHILQLHGAALRADEPLGLPGPPGP